MAANAPSGAGARQIQESDLFKAAPGGLLYLLNDYRGLQVVSFAAGPDKPDLLARVPATGNYPKDMYSIEGTGRLVVLESYWSGGPFYSDEQGRALVYDASDPAKPFLAQEVPIKGEISDSRIVGDVLYVASSARAWRSGESDSAGYVTSFRLRAGKLERIQEYRLQQAVASGLVGISETRENGQFKYYLVSVLSETGWGWGERESMVEVVDISDPGGEIRPVMAVSARGVVGRRSMALVIGKALVVASNYRLDKSNWESPMRVSVETFNFPGEKPEILTELQASYRKIAIEAALEGKSAEEARALRETLESDPKIGVKGRFVRAAPAPVAEPGVPVAPGSPGSPGAPATPVAGQLRKLVPDSSVVTRPDDEKNASALLEDVRYQDGLLYAFWVPSSQVDPLDIFSIDPDKGVSFLSRLKFDGWIERAQPFMLNGQRYIVGLGWAIPASGDDDRRRPQAAIYKVSPSGASWRAIEVAQIAIDEKSDIWTNFRGPDKYVEIRETEPGKGQALFSAYRWIAHQAPQDGGKIVYFDLNKAAAGAADALAEGPFLVGDSGWVRRVFTNLDRINVFSNQALGVFKAGPGADIQNATAVLELARMVRAFTEVPVAGRGDRLGAQIVSDYSYSWLENAKAASTEARFVALGAPDAEAKDVLARVSVPGEYVSHYVDASGALYLLSSTTKNFTTEVNGQTNWTSEITSYVSRVSLSASASDGLPTATATTASWKTVEQPRGPGYGRLGARFGNGFGIRQNASFVPLPDGTLIAQNAGTIQSVRLGGSALELREIGIDQATCRLQDRIFATFRRGDDGTFFVSSADALTFPEYPGARFAKNYVTIAAIANGQIRCSAEYNIPGEALSLTASGAITKDAYAQDIFLKTYEYKTRDENGKETQQTEVRAELLRREQLASVAFKDGLAVMADALDGGTYSYEPIGNGTIAKLGSENPNSSYYGESDDVDTPLVLDFIRQDAGGFLQGRAFRLFLKVGNWATISGLWSDKSGGTVAVLNGNQRAQAVRWLDLEKGDRPEVVPLQAMNIRGELEKEQEWVRVPGYFYGGGQPVAYSPERATISFSLGLAGVMQARLANSPPIKLVPALLSPASPDGAQPASEPAGEPQQVRQ